MHLGKGPERSELLRTPGRFDRTLGPSQNTRDAPPTRAVEKKNDIREVDDKTKHARSALIFIIVLLDSLKSGGSIFPAANVEEYAQKTHMSRGESVRLL